jgi:Abortive infection alpha
MNDDNMKKEDLKVVADIIKSVPIYQDAIQPAAKEVSKALVTVTKAINTALAPIKLIVWGYDQIEEYLTSKIAKKLKHTPKKNIITPPTYIAGPAIEALRFAGHDEDLRELYANLLATAMDRNSTDKAHPGYVEIIKNLTPNEARLLKFFVRDNEIPLINVELIHENGYSLLLANYTLLNEYLKLESGLKICVYVTNLCRLGILEVPYGLSLADTSLYDKLENSEVIIQLSEDAMKKDKKLKIERGLLRFTDYGKDFIDCVVC